MLGMIEGNGHPYSWSAIVNGYRSGRDGVMPLCWRFIDYLGQQPLETVRIPGARVTHLWTDDPADARRSLLPASLRTSWARPEDVIGQVDAVDHFDGRWRRSRPRA